MKRGRGSGPLPLISRSSLDLILVCRNVLAHLDCVTEVLRETDEEMDLKIVHINLHVFHISKIA